MIFNLINISMKFHKTHSVNYSFPLLLRFLVALGILCTRQKPRHIHIISICLFIFISLPLFGRTLAFYSVFSLFFFWFGFTFKYILYFHVCVNLPFIILIKLIYLLKFTIRVNVPPLSKLMLNLTFSCEI